MTINASSFSLLGQFARPRVDFSAYVRPGEKSFDWGFDFELPFEQLSVFARHIDSAAPITRLPVFAIAQFGLTEKSIKLLTDADVNVNLIFPRVPLGVVGTDHVGYGSFDLWPLRRVQVVQVLKELLTEAELLKAGMPRLTLGLSKLELLPFKDPAISFDAITEGDHGPNFISVRMDLDDFMLAGRAEWPPMPAMQTPGILDWRLSPGSFSMSGALLIGEDGCETLLPGNLATRLIRFRQIIRTATKAKANIPPQNAPLFSIFSGDIRLGYAVQYNTEWFPLGHSLGQIAYSLPLAPGEKMNIAVVDWSRQDVAKRIEKTTEKEDLKHATLRDRTLNEAVQMVVNESQSGSSFMAGGALSAGAGIPIGPVTLGLGESFGAGGATASSQGMRSVVGNTTQTINDAFHQASSALRELNSTIVVQAEQVEAAQATTRVVANYNHSHALTILYYEVLQHHRVLTRPASMQPVLFLKHDVPSFDGKPNEENKTDYALIEQHQAAIAGSLLDESLRECLAVVSKRACMQINFDREKQRRDAQGVPSDNFELGEFSLLVLTGATSPLSVVIQIIPKAGNIPMDCNFKDPLIVAENPNTKQPIPTILNNFPPVHIQANQEFITICQPAQKIRWGNVKAIKILGGGTWDIQRIRFATQNGTDAWIMFDGGPFPPSPEVEIEVVSFKPPLTSVDDLLSDQERCCLKRLTDHLNAHRGHYWRAIWLAENATDRSIRLDEWQVAGIPLLDLVENKLLSFEGGYAVMPITSGAEDTVGSAFKIKDIQHAQLPYNEFVEQILTLPARGVFAEAKLGHCNASEIIDPTRFWDWQTSPIPDQAPAIAPASTDSRFQDPTKSLTPTAFPTSLVNIVNPQSLPDPSGFGAASGILSALGPFRDMSGIKELAPFLQNLSNNATQLASQGLKNAQTTSLMNAIRSAKEIPADQRADLISELLTGQVKNHTAPVPTSDNPTKPGEDPAKPGSTPTTQTSNGGSKPSLTPSPKPQRASTLSSKTRLLVFSFKYDTGEVLTGNYTVLLTPVGGRSEAEVSKRMIRTSLTSGASGVNVGDRIEMYVEETFGRDGVEVNITGTIVGLPQTLSAGKRVYETRVWTDIALPSRTNINGADFAKTHVFEVTQPTQPITFTVLRKVTATQAETNITSKSNGLEVGIEASVEAKASIEILEGKETVKINSKGTRNLTATSQILDQSGTEYTEQVVFNGRGLLGGLTIKAV